MPLFAALNWRFVETQLKAQTYWITSTVSTPDVLRMLDEHSYEFCVHVNHVNTQSEDPGSTTSRINNEKAHAAMISVALGANASVRIWPRKDTKRLYEYPE